VLKAELMEMAEQKNGFLFGEVVRRARAHRGSAASVLARLVPARRRTCLPLTHAAHVPLLCAAPNTTSNRSLRRRESRASGRTGS
jgi:hypothetical protein